MIRPITIKPVMNGFIATVGCQEIVFPSVVSLVTGITEYYTDPAGTEKRYRESAVNKTLIQPEQPAANYGAVTTREASFITQASGSPQGQQINTQNR